MARAIWSGSIGFGLVQIPVSLHGAEEKSELELTMLDRRDFSPVGYERVNKKTGKDVPWNEVVKGHEHSEGKYVILTDEDFESANVETSRQVDILAFVDFASVDPRYIDRPYYLAPQKAGKKAYALLREALLRTGKAGIGKVVIRTRQHLAAVVARDKALVLVLLRFADELRDESDLGLPELGLSRLGITSKEVSMAEHLIQGMTEEFDPKNYRDDYRQDLMKLIRSKAKAGELNTVNEAKAPARKKEASAKVIDLAALLAQSVSGAKGKKAGPRSAARSRTARSKASRSPGHRSNAHKKSA